MFDKFPPFRQVQKESFVFEPIRFELWVKGRINTSFKCSTKVHFISNFQQNTIHVRIENSHPSLTGYLDYEFDFDIYFTQIDRLMMATVPPRSVEKETDGLTMMRSVIGCTRGSKSFRTNEPYCCSFFYRNGQLVKIAFALAITHSMTEFYFDEETVFEVDLSNVYFVSEHHLKFKNNKQVDALFGSKRAIKIEPNIEAKKGYIASIINLEHIENNVEFTSEEMKVVQIDSARTVLKAWRNELTESSPDYGLTLFHPNKEIKKIFLHLYRSNEEIIYYLNIGVFSADAHIYNLPI